MSALGFAVLFVLFFAITMSWLALSLDARMGRSRKVCQLPLPFEALGRVRAHKRPSDPRPVLALAGSMLLFFAAMGAVALGQLATITPETGVAIFQTYPWLQSFWRPLMAFGPIGFVAMVVPGVVCLNRGLDSLGSR